MTVHRKTYVNDLSLKRKNQRTTNEQRTNVPNVSTNYPNVPSIWSEKYERVKAKIHTIFQTNLRPVSTQENSPRIGTKFNLLMCLQFLFMCPTASVGLRWAVHRYKIASNWAKNWHRWRMFRLNFVPIRSDRRIIFLSGNQPLREYSNERCTVRAKLLCSASTNCNNYYKNNFIARMYVHLHSNFTRPLKLLI